MSDFYGNIKAGSKDVSIIAILRNTTNNQEISGKLAADVTAKYWRQGKTPVTITLHDLSSLELQHSDGGWKEGTTGAYRLDLPDSAVTEDSDWVLISVSTSGGYVFHERYNLEKDPNTTDLSSDASLLSSELTNSYIDVSGADNYFSTRLNSDIWDDSTNTDKQKALIEATRLIDNLNFEGTKHTTAQTLQFPRGDDTVIPNDIKIATCELAISLLDDIDLDEEVNALRVESDGYSSVKATYNSNIASDHVRSGIVSIRAWNKLLPYLRDPRQIKLNRVS